MINKFMERPLSENKVPPYPEKCFQDVRSVDPQA